MNPRPEIAAADFEGHPSPITPGGPSQPASATRRRADGAPRAQPSNLATCPTCPARWTGLAAAHCTGCHETFSGVSLFDRHRTAAGERGACRPPADLSDCEFRDGMWRGPRYDGFGGGS